MLLNDKKILTLMMILKKANPNSNPKILLGMKKKGFGQGKWNGFGGKVEKNEGIFDAAVREVKEECGLEILNAKFVGFITFEYEIDKKAPMHVHIFKSEEFAGDPIETAEMIPQWFEIDEIPYEKMWKDDVYWYPYLFADKYFYGKFLFSDYENILSYNLKESEQTELIEIQKKIANHDL